MSESPPSQQTLRRANVLWAQSVDDLKSAKAHQRQGDGLQCSLLSLQAAVNSLSAVCHLNGHFQLPLGNLTELTALCVEADGRFEALLGTCPRLHEAMDENPFARERDAVREGEMGRACLDEAGRVHKLVKAYLKENHSRFFKP